MSRITHGVSLILSLIFSTAPQATFAETRSWRAVEGLAADFISKLNLTEKAGLVTGSLGPGTKCIGGIAAIPRLNFSGLCLADGPAGINRNDLVSVFPAGISVAATWDRDLMARRGVAIGEEFRDKGAHVYLGPVGGPLGKHPLGGRNWEGFGVDPYLNGVAMRETVQGVQSVGVQTVPKHFILNEQETQRSNTVSPNGTAVEAISSNVDDRTLHEIYLWPFADAVKAGATSIMCSYNRVNGTYVCENERLLNKILKNELGFRGYVMSDWFATHSGVPAILSGQDMNMPGPINQLDLTHSLWGENLVRAVNNGSLSEDRLDDMIRRMLSAFYVLGQDEGFPSVDPSSQFVIATQYGQQAMLGTKQVPARDVRREHAKLIREIGAAAIVLLKNTNATLPLIAPRNIGVFGNAASEPAAGLTSESFTNSQTGPEFGTLDIGGGSGTVRHTSIVSPLEAVQAWAKTYGTRVQYILDNKILSSNDFTSIYPTPEVCLVFLKSWASEGVDRVAFENDWNSTLVVNNVASRCTNTIVIIQSGNVNTIPFATNPNVTAILTTHFSGEQLGNSIVDVLWGNINPSGRLPYTIPIIESDYNIPIVNITGPEKYNSSAWQSDFSEGQLIDYHRFDVLDIIPRYEFGFGLSYTTFNITGPLSLLLSSNGTPANISAFPDISLRITPGGNPDLWNPLITASASVTNTGKFAGATIAQLYVSLPRQSIPDPDKTPIKKLRGFEKMFLQPGETKEVRFKLNRRDISYWDVEKQTWRIPQGMIGIKVGFSSRDLRVGGVVTLL